jgi:thiamine biosynthesis lipoprotein
MTSCLPSTDAAIERAKPLLGTTVSLRVSGLEPARAHAAIDAGFDALRAVHEAMSFHERDSDVSRLNRDAHKGPVQVDEATYTVIVQAQALSARSEGAFDITVAPLLVARGLLPCPAHAPDPDGAAIWRDIELLPENHIRFRRPLWIDLGGIAKGYAVDCATEILRGFEPRQASVNAGGDLRVFGPDAECVRLAADRSEDIVPIFRLKEASLASSESRCGGPHIDMRRRRHEPRQFVSVAAPRCVDADALTKVVMMRGENSAPVLDTYGASAAIYDTAHGWREIRGHA